MCAHMCVHVCMRFSSKSLVALSDCQKCPRFLKVKNYTLRIYDYVQTPPHVSEGFSLLRYSHSYSSLCVRELQFVIRNGFKIGVRRPEYGRRTCEVRERSERGQRPSLGHPVWRPCATRANQPSGPVWPTRPTRGQG